MTLVLQVIEAREKCEDAVKHALTQYHATTGFHPLSLDFQMIDTTRVDSEHKVYMVGDVHMRSET